MSKQLPLFETTDQYGNDIVQGPKIEKQDLDFVTKTIDPKNPHTVGKSFANLGNHVLLTGFIGAIIFVIVASYG